MAGIALIVAALGGGMLNDSFNLAPRFGKNDMRPDEWQVIAVPLAMLLIGMSLTWAFWRDRSAWRLTPPLALFGLFAAWCALSLLHSHYLHAGVTMLAILTASLALGFVLSRTVRTREAALFALFALALAASIVAGIGVREYLWTWRQEHNALWRVFSTFVNPDFLAGFLVMTTVVTAALFLTVEERLLILLAGIALILQAVCLLLTQSRLGIAALLLALMVLAALGLWSGALAGSARRRALIIAGALLLAGIVFARPILRRFQTSGGESYSAKFRLYTWQGTARMAAAHPLFGTGLGTFETAYPPYAVVGYTQHAHDSFLQLAGETGFPGALLLLAALGAVLATGIRSLRAVSQGDRETDEVQSKVVNRKSKILLCGLLAAIAGAAAHNLFDSDLYLPANAFTLAAICGLALALSRSLTQSPNDPITQRPNHPTTLLPRYIAGLGAVLLIAQAVRTADARLQAWGAAGAAREGNLPAAIEGYKGAAAVEGGNPEHFLSLALLYQAERETEKARRAYEDALKAAPIGKVLYRYGKFLAPIDPAQAVRMLEMARAAEPLNLQNLLALADAHSLAGRPADAENVYRQMVALDHTPFGEVRAMPELVVWEFGDAYLHLGEAARARGDNAQAERNLREAVHLLYNFWRTRDLLIAQISVPSEVRQKTADLYDRALEGWAGALQSLGRTAEAEEARRQQAAFRAEREKESMDAGSP
jgi:O-antigen ligase/tetratricopeptide (TPR) repeat protein